MNRAALVIVCLLAMGPLAFAEVKPDKDGFYSLFDGKTLDGWKANEKPEVFKVDDGQILVNGPRSHLFYVGPVADHNFKNFHFKAEVKTWKNSNSGIYFHTKYQDSGWPSAGYECQVNNSHSDWRKTGGLYGIKDVKEPPTKDDKWFLYEIIVKDKEITIKLDGQVVTQFAEPGSYTPPADFAGRKLASGTFALQGHDPGSKVAYRNIMVKPL
jgi:Domain of Unknown Function (DUF1080)